LTRVPSPEDHPCLACGACCAASRVDFAVYASKKLVERVGKKAPYAAYPWLNWDERLNARWLDEWLA